MSRPYRHVRGLAGVVHGYTKRRLLKLWKRNPERGGPTQVERDTHDFAKVFVFGNNNNLAGVDEVLELKEL